LNKYESYKNNCKKKGRRDICQVKGHKDTPLLNEEMDKRERVNLSPEKIMEEYVEFYFTTYGVEPLLDEED
jgi:hypothetical protein